MVNDYPMSYIEYKQRVNELFLVLADYPSDLENRKTFLEEEEEIIKGEYASACYEYDHPEEYGDTTKNNFTDENLIHQPIRILDMLY